MPVGVMRDAANDACHSDVGHRPCLSGAGSNRRMQGRKTKLVKIIKTRDLIGSRLYGNPGVISGGVAASAGRAGGTEDKVMD